MSKNRDLLPFFHSSYLIWQITDGKADISIENAHFFDYLSDSHRHGTQPKPYWFAVFVTFFHRFFIFLQRFPENEQK